MYKNLIVNRIISSNIFLENKIDIEIPPFYHGFSHYKIENFRCRIKEYTQGSYLNNGKLEFLSAPPNDYKDVIVDQFQNNTTTKLPLNNYFCYITSNGENNTTILPSVLKNEEISFDLVAIGTIKDNEVMAESDWIKKPPNNKIYLSVYNQEFLKVAVIEYFVNLKLSYID